MIEYPYRAISTVSCSCCGQYIANTPEENASLHEPEGLPYAHDDGYGMCYPCGGDPTADVEDLSETNMRKRMGWGTAVFYDSRIPVMEKALNETNATKFRALDYAGKIAVVRAAIEKGLMI